MKIPLKIAILWLILSTSSVSYAQDYTYKKVFVPRLKFKHHLCNATRKLFFRKLRRILAYNAYVFSEKEYRIPRRKFGEVFEDLTKKPDISIVFILVYSCAVRQDFNGRHLYVSGLLLGPVNKKWVRVFPSTKKQIWLRLQYPRLSRRAYPSIVRQHRRLMHRGADLMMTGIHTAIAQKRLIARDSKEDFQKRRGTKKVVRKWNQDRKPFLAYLRLGGGTMSDVSDNARFYVGNLLPGVTLELYSWYVSVDVGVAFESPIQPFSLSVIGGLGYRWMLYDDDVIMVRLGLAASYWGFNMYKALKYRREFLMTGLDFHVLGNVSRWMFGRGSWLYGAVRFQALALGMQIVRGRISYAAALTVSLSICVRFP